MPVATTVVGLITAIATGITALGGFIVALTVLLPILKRTKETERRVEEVHVMVNQQKTDAERYQRQLIEALKAAGVSVPKDQSKEG